MKIETPVYDCARIESADGFPPLNWEEGPWREASLISDFMQVDGRTQPTIKTQARLLWDDQALYVAFDCEDRNIWGNYTEHNDPIYDEEIVELFLDPWGHGKKYFEFEISPRGVVFAATVENSLTDPPLVTPDYNIPIKELDWQVEVDGKLNDPASVDQSWKAGMRIPFAALGLDAPKAGDAWRMNLFRIERDQGDQYICWSPTFTEPAAFHHPKYFGKLRFRAF